jgi:large subunit ribosomal protein L10
LIYIVRLEVQNLSKKAIEVKSSQVDALAKKFSDAQSIIFYDYRGLTVAEVSELRNQFRDAGIEYKVIKNNLLKRAAKANDVDGLDELLIGPTAVAIGYEDPVAGAKVLVDFVKKAKKTEIRAGILSGKMVSLDEIKKLSELPSREQLIAMVAGTLNQPIAGLAMALNAIPTGLARALNAVGEQKQQ